MACRISLVYIYFTKTESKMSQNHVGSNPVHSTICFVADMSSFNGNALPHHPLNITT